MTIIFNEFVHSLTQTTLIFTVFIYLFIHFHFLFGVRFVFFSFVIRFWHSQKYIYLFCCRFVFVSIRRNRILSYCFRLRTAQYEMMLWVHSAPDCSWIQLMRLFMRLFLSPGLWWVVQLFFVYFIFVCVRLCHFKFTFTFLQLFLTVHVFDTHTQRERETNKEKRARTPFFALPLFADCNSKTIITIRIDRTAAGGVDCSISLVVFWCRSLESMPRCQLIFDWWRS